ncbi:MAG: hypothetical protein ABW110_18380 [Steroidobacteraceae bacterium]
MNAARSVRSICRICFGACDVVVHVDEQGRIAGIRGDKQHPLSEGFICIKGAQAAEQANGPKRLLHPVNTRRTQYDHTRVGTAASAIVACAGSMDGELCLEYRTRLIQREWRSHLPRSTDAARDG